MLRFYSAALLLALGSGALLKQAGVLAAEVRQVEQVSSIVEETFTVPTLAADSPNVMLREAMKLTADQKNLVAAAKAEYLQRLLRQIVQSSGDSWEFDLYPSTDGAFIYVGPKNGYYVVVSPLSKVFKTGLAGTKAAIDWGSGLELTKVDGQWLLKPNYQNMIQIN